MCHHLSYVSAYFSLRILSSSTISFSAASTDRYLVMPSSVSRFATWSWGRQCSVQSIDSTWSATSEYYLQYPWEDRSRGTGFAVCVSTSTERDVLKPSRKKRRGTRRTLAVQSLSSRTKPQCVVDPSVGSSSLVRGFRKRSVDEECVDSCEVKRLKIDDVRRVERSIRDKFGFDERLTVEEVNRWIELQEQRLKLAELRFMQSCLQMDVDCVSEKVPPVDGFVEGLSLLTQTCSLESLSSLCPSSLETEVVQAADGLASFDLDLQKFDSNFTGDLDVDLGFSLMDWTEDGVMLSEPVDVLDDFGF